MHGPEFHMQVLGLTGRPTKAQITKAYRREINKWHPDRHQRDGWRQNAEEAAKLINAAYAFLKEHKFADPASNPPPSAARRAEPKAQPSRSHAVNQIIPVNTRMIIAARYEVDTRSLILFFRNGHISRFTQVPSAVFDKFLASRTKDAFVATNVLHTFPEEKIA
jgi:DnaJ domain/KTSC domain